MAFRAGILARLALTGAICLVSFGYSKCAFVSDTCGTGVVSSSSGGPPISGTLQTLLGLRDSTGTLTNDFRFGESIRFDLEVRNRTGQTVNLVFDDAQVYDFVVMDAVTNRVRWRWSDGMAFAQVRTELVFDPYSSKAYSVVWNGVLADGTQLPPGSYRARGALVFDEFASDPLTPNDQGSPIVNFTVR